jgi:hypothetical protein
MIIIIINIFTLKLDKISVVLKKTIKKSNRLNKIIHAVYYGNPLF